MTHRSTACHIAATARRLRRVVKVAVAGYGKLGGLELGYGSDLDLVFLHDSAGEIAADARRAAARQRRVLPAPRAAHRAPADHAFRGGTAV